MFHDKPVISKMIRIVILHAVVLICLALIATLALKNYFYTSAKKAFEEGQYEVFSHYLNLSDKDYFELPSDTSNVPSSVFADCKNLKFNEYGGCRYLGSQGNPYYALVSAYKAEKSYEIHPRTVVICDGAFGGYKSISNFVVPIENERFVSVDGSLYTKDMTRLIHYATGREDENFIVPETVKTIDAFAFYYDSHLKSIVLPNHLQRIGDHAFGYSLIEHVEIPNTAVVIGEGAFSNSAIRSMTD